MAQQQFSMTDVITALINKFVPKSAVQIDPRKDGLHYLHPTKGWRRVAWRRIGINPLITA